MSKSARSGDLGLAFAAGAGMVVLLGFVLWIILGLPVTLLSGNLAAVLRPEIDQDSNTVPCPVPDRFSSSKTLTSGSVEDALQAVGHPTNPVWLDRADLQAVLSGEIDRWSELDSGKDGAIIRYTADPETLNRLGLLTPDTVVRRTWDQVLAAVRQNPGAVALAPQKHVDYRVRVMAEPLDPETGDNVPFPETKTIVLVGDIMLANWMGALLQAKTLMAGDLRYPFGATARILETADISAGNLECPVVTGKKGPFYTLDFAGDPAGLDRLAAGGVDIVSLANNHILNQGVDGLAETMKHLETRSIEYIGAGGSFKHAYSPRIVKLEDGTKVAWLGFAAAGMASRPDRNGPTMAVGGPAGRHHLESIRQARQQADLVIVYMHWGIEFDNAPSAGQRKLGHALVEAGADIVVGAHPHCVQGIEFYQNALIAYSLGNFAFALNEISDRVAAVTGGAILRCRLWKGRLYQFELIPILEDLGQPFPLTGDCPDPGLRQAYWETLQKVYDHSLF